MLGWINYILLTLTLAFIVWLHISMMMGRKKNNSKKISDIAYEESEANFARKKPLPDDFYFQPDISDLPVKDYADPKCKAAVKQARVLKLVNAKMIRLPSSMTNLEIKMDYGVANLETVTNGEEVYQGFLEALLSWAGVLSDNGDNEDAKKILEKAIELGCDISRCFISLAKLYLADCNKNSIEKLIKQLESGEIMSENEAVRNKTIAEIKKMYDNI
ncbi:MAG: hypothetical protein FWE29_04815 [Defluviitaleaceae bacterium]|nr:hypothetical protein [Defluviitaleaceae bacterium]